MLQSAVWQKKMSCIPISAFIAFGVIQLRTFPGSVCGSIRDVEDVMWMEMGF